MSLISVLTTSIAFCSARDPVPVVATNVDVVAPNVAPKADASYDAMLIARVLDEAAPATNVDVVAPNVAPKADASYDAMLIARVLDEAAPASENSDSGSPVCEGWKLYADSQVINGSEFPATGYFCTTPDKTYQCVSGPGASTDQLTIDNPCSSSMKVVGSSWNQADASYDAMLIARSLYFPALDSAKSADSGRSLYFPALDSAKSADSGRSLYFPALDSADSADSDNSDGSDEAPECSKWDNYSNDQLDYGAAISENLTGYFCSTQGKTYKCASDTTNSLTIVNPCPESAKLPASDESKTQPPPATSEQSVTTQVPPATGGEASTTTVPVTNEASTTGASECSSWSKVSEGQTLQITGSDTAGLFCNNSDGVWKCNDSSYQGLLFENCPGNMKSKDNANTLIII